MMTGRERLLAVVRGEVPDRVPFSPNIGQWFSAHKAWGKLPPELAHCDDEVDAMKAMGADIFSRRCGNFVRAEYGPDISFEHNRLAEDETSTIVNTPEGILTGVTVFAPESHTSYEREHLWKDFDREYAVVRHLIENTDYHFNAEAYRAADERVGDDGLVIIAAQQNPLKRVINLAGPEQAILWTFDHEKQMLDLMEIHTEKSLAFAREVADAGAFGMMSMDNLCSLFFSPDFFAKYCADYYRRIGEVLHAAGIFWCAHACGRVTDLKELVADVELDGLEGTPHPPLGDIDFASFRDTITYPRHVVWGGMTCHEQEVRVEAQERLTDHVRAMFEPLRPFRRFIFSSACNTSVRTPYDNLRYLRDACHEIGKN